MRRVSLALSSLALFASCTLPAWADATTPTTHNKALAFAEFWDATKDKPTAERVALFKSSVAAKAPAFYGVERFDGRLTQEERDKHIARAIEEFPSIREGYLRKAKQFDAELPRYIESFKTFFPDFKPTHDIWVLHSLGEMDGGTRTLAGRSSLIFGIDGMVKYHNSEDDETPFFHHELFHTYHRSASNCEDKGMWSKVWIEGLATYVSKVMNPDANNSQLLLAIPEGMVENTQANMPKALAHLESVLGKDDWEIYGGLFQGKKDDTGLSPRRGYYLGYLIAEEAAKKHDVRELAKLGCKPARELVYEAVKTLKAKYQ